MKIKDLNGNELEIENLQLAILQADDYRHFRHIDPAYQAMDKRLQAYWIDVYQQLIAIEKSDQNA